MADFNTFQPQQCHVKSSVLKKTSKDLRQSIKNQTHVSTTLATHLLSKEFPDSNVVFWPLSIHVVISLLAAGSKGKTRDQILGFLKANTTDELNSLYSKLVSLIIADGSPSGGPRLAFANGLWFDKTVSLKPSFKQVVDTVYTAACKQVHFQNKVAKKVNLWATKQTNGLINNVISADEIHELTSLIIANAVYFKGEWSAKFNESETKEFDFHLLDGNKVQVPFMTSTEDKSVQEYDDFKVLGLSYFKGRDKRKFKMYFFLPDAKDGLQALAEKIGSTSDFLDCHIPCKKVQVGRFLIPKFKISFNFEASHMLEELGLVLPFAPGNVLTDMVDSPNGQTLDVSGIHQESFVEVNEEGTKAAALTEFRSLRSSGRHKVRKLNKVDFVADHPFLFVIREYVTGVVLFMGHVINPSDG